MAPDLKKYGGVCVEHPRGFGLCQGKGHGDEGNWKLEGSQGSAFLGVWGADGDLEIKFKTPVVGFSMDVFTNNSGNSMRATFYGVKERKSSRHLEPEFVIAVQRSIASCYCD